MSDVCQQLEAFHFDLRLIKRDGIEFVEAKRTDATKVSKKVANDLLLQLSRAQDEAVAYLKPRQPQYLALRMREIENTDWSKTSTDQEAALIYEFCAVAAEAGLGPKRTSDGREWKDFT